jgi:hypothetical protein
VKHSALVWHYRSADPDLGNCQVRWVTGLKGPMGGWGSGRWVANGFGELGARRGSDR